MSHIFFLQNIYTWYQHVRMFCFREEGDRMMVIFYNPTSIHLSRVGWVMRKSCGLGHRRYWFPGSPIPRLYASRRHYFWAERQNYGLEASSPNLVGSVFEEKSGSSSVSGNRLFDSFVRGIGEKWSEMAGGGGGRQPGLILMTSNTRGIIPAILPILELYFQYWSKKSKNHIQTLSPTGPVYNSPLLSAFWKQVFPMTSIWKGFMLGTSWMWTISPVRLRRYFEI